MDSVELQRLPLRAAFLYFLIPCAAGYLWVFGVMPRLDDYGVPFYFNYLVFGIALAFFLLAAAFVFYRREGNPLTWSALRARFRLHKMDGRAWLWTAGLVIAMGGSLGLLLVVAPWLGSIALPTPAFWQMDLPIGAAGNGPPTQFMGMTLKGNWWILAVEILVLVLAILGEELWWRGYILPRQELVHGRATWLIHGTLWAAFHAFSPINPVLLLLPGCLALSYVAQRLKNTTPCLIAHLLVNGMLPIAIIVRGILG